ncbi:hypothetical protein Nmel_014268 [Mimus melanotis]
MEPIWCCEDKNRKKKGEPAGWYLANESYLGVNKVGDFYPIPLQPQELDIFGSMQSFACFFLNLPCKLSAQQGFVLDVTVNKENPIGRTERGRCGNITREQNCEHCSACHNRHGCVNHSSPQALARNMMHYTM